MKPAWYPQGLFSHRSSEQFQNQSKRAHELFKPHTHTHTHTKKKKGATVE